MENKTLAQVYKNIASYTANNKYRDISKALLDSKVNVADFYSERSSLKNLNIKGVGPVAKRLLRVILKGGEEFAKRYVERTSPSETPKKIRTMYADIDSDEFKIITGFTEPVSALGKGSWDNLVKAVEDER